MSGMAIDNYFVQSMMDTVFIMAIKVLLHNLTVKVI